MEIRPEVASPNKKKKKKQLAKYQCTCTVTSYSVMQVSIEKYCLSFERT